MQLACAPFCGTDLAMWVADTGAVYAFHVRIPIESNFPGEAGDPTIVWYAPPSWQIYLPGFNRGGFPPCFYSPDVPPPIGYVDVVVYTSDPSAKASNFVVYWANSSPEPSNPHNVNSILKNQCLVDHPK